MPPHLLCETIMRHLWHYVNRFLCIPVLSINDAIFAFNNYIVSGFTYWEEDCIEEDLAEFFEIYNWLHLNKMILNKTLKGNLDSHINELKKYISVEALEEMLKGEDGH